MTLNWELVVERMINDHPNIGSFLEKGSVVSMTAGSIVLGYSKKDSIARWRTDKPENRVLIGQICEEFAGTLVTDFWGPYNAVVCARRQVCLARLETRSSPARTGRRSRKNYAGCWAMPCA